MVTMLKAEYTHRGPVPHEVIDAVPMELSAPRAGQVMLEVLAAPINPSDVLTLTGEYGQLPDLPAVGGNEGVGRVSSVGEGVDELEPGRLVMLPLGSGTWRTHMIADASMVVPLPQDADPLQMSMVAVNPPTASLLLSEFVALEPGDWIIQNAANSGVGGYVIQLAKQRGLRTVNVVRRESAIDHDIDRGGDVCVVDGPGLRDRVRSAIDAANPALGLDAVAGTATGHLASTLAGGGTVVNYGGMSGEPCSIPPLSLVFNDVTVRGFWLVTWFRRSSREERATMFAEMATMVAGGRLAAPIAATYPVEHVSEAVKHAASGQRQGKVLIVPARGDVAQDYPPGSSNLACVQQ